VTGPLPLLESLRDCSVPKHSLNASLEKLLKRRCTLLILDVYFTLSRPSSNKVFLLPSLLGRWLPSSPTRQILDFSGPLGLSPLVLRVEMQLGEKYWTEIKYSFANRVVDIWNKLSDDVVSNSTVP
jgi:hypothetical protein